MKLSFCSIRTEKGRHLCSRDSGWSLQDPGRQRENQQILREGIEHHAECWRGSGQRMCFAGMSLLNVYKAGLHPSHCSPEKCHLSAVTKLQAWTSICWCLRIISVVFLIVELTFRSFITMCKKSKQTNSSSASWRNNKEIPRDKIKETTNNDHIN